MGSFEVEKIQNHRSIYLTYEGEVSGNRGVVKRVSQGRAVLSPKPTDSGEFPLHIEALVRWDRKPEELIRYLIDSHRGNHWKVRRQ
jgi:hypothetical protein